jgi:hypothetical protein
LFFFFIWRWACCILESSLLDRSTSCRSPVVFEPRTHKVTRIIIRAPILDRFLGLPLATIDPLWQALFWFTASCFNTRLTVGLCNLMKCSFSSTVQYLPPPPLQTKYFAERKWLTREHKCTKKPRQPPPPYPIGGITPVCGSRTHDYLSARSPPPHPFLWGGGILVFFNKSHTVCDMLRYSNQYTIVNYIVIWNEKSYKMFE